MSYLFTKTLCFTAQLWVSTSTTCCRCVTGFVSLILKAVQGRFVIPDFSTFSDETQKLFTKCKQLSTVQVSPRIQLGHIVYRTLWLMAVP